MKVENVHWDEEKKRAELVKNTPTATFPYLKTSRGVISETYAIVQYLAGSYNRALLGSSDWERAQVDQWVEFAHLELARYNQAIIYPLFGWQEFCKEKYDAAFKEVREWLKVLNNHLSGKDFVVGNSYTLADLELFFILRNYYQFVFVDEIRKNQFPNITSWFTKLAQNTNVLAGFGRTILCKTPQKAAKFEKKAAAKKEEPKKEEVKKVEKPKVAEGEEAAEGSSKKKANPLDVLPPSTFVLDEFKREFMNSKDRAAVMEEFWKKFDPSGFSLWTMKYDKLPSEGKILFRTKNSLSFFLQKLDTFRKFSFSAHGIYGVEGDYDIKGCWMWRGIEIPEEVNSYISL